MIVHAFLIVSNRGQMRVTKNRPALSSNEICIRFQITVPKEFFDRQMPLVTLELPKESVINPDTEQMVTIAAEKVSDSLNIDFVDVRDGLAEMVEEAKKKAEKKRG